jgi:hypothetical protein
MKKLLFACLVAVAMSLGACASTGGLSASDITSFEDALIADSIAICGFEPTVATAAALIADAVVPSSSAVTTVATTLAGQVCQAMTSASTTATGRRGAVAAPVVDGVAIRGHFVAKSALAAAAVAPAAPVPAAPTVDGVPIQGQFVK